MSDPNQRLSAAKSRISKHVLAEDTFFNRAKKTNGCDIEILKNRTLFRVSHDSQQRPIDLKGIRVFWSYNGYIRQHIIVPIPNLPLIFLGIELGV